ncbi:NADPH-dependent F420 reductase [Saccharomonospora xinjiangensis]|uniref:NADPH-dependent F420 reductase n=1 Tax=Saccharomonospora xinjiangensis TaxID=75294 RepID=UPI00106F47E5|nr:NADPH-dependent F420 reductase [Saccharomonospora xinjiangensis]QBQ59862.1 NADP oxidoreductase coenzyme F420-dependent [Saccharomonospora xinjiangensis]
MTNLSIIGCGNMGRGIATRALAGRNPVQLLDRDPGRASALASELTGEVTSGEVGDPLSGDVVVLAVPYEAAIPLVTDYGDALNGKVVIDITNPVDFASFDRLVTPPETSAAEEIAAAAPRGARVVKAFNTTFAGTLVTGQVAGQPLDVLLAGDDDDAKATVASVVEAGGLRAIDAGPLRRARQLEHTGFLHMALQQPLGTEFGSALRFLS